MVVESEAFFRVASQGLFSGLSGDRTFTTGVRPYGFSTCSPNKLLTRTEAGCASGESGTASPGCDWSLPETSAACGNCPQVKTIKSAKFILQAPFDGRIILVYGTLVRKQSEPAQFTQGGLRNVAEFVLVLVPASASNTLPQVQEKPMVLNVVVVGMGQWTLEQYAPGLKNFLKSQFLPLNDVVLNIWFVDPEPSGAVKLSDRRTVVRFQQIMDVFDIIGPLPNRYGKNMIYVEEGYGGTWRLPNPEKPDVVFVVAPSEYHTPTARHFVQDYNPMYIIVEKPFCITEAYQHEKGLDADQCANATEYYGWREKVFGFDHYLTRLFCLIYYHSKGQLGKVERLIFRLREKKSPKEIGSVQDMGAHAVPLLLLFAEPLAPLDYPWRWPRSSVAAPPYFQFEQHKWRCRQEQWLHFPAQENCIVDVGIGWYEDPNKDLPDGEQNVPDKFFCIECSAGRIWADLAQPFLVFIEGKPHDASPDWAKCYPQLNSSVQTWGFAAREPVHLMINAVCWKAALQKLKGSPAKEPPLAVLPTSHDDPHYTTAERIMNILNDWDTEYHGK